MGLRDRLERAARRAVAAAGGALDRAALRAIERAVVPPDGSPRAADPRARLLALAAHYGAPAMLADPGALFAAPTPIDDADVAIAERGRDGARRISELRFASRYLPSLAAHVEAHAAASANLTAVARLFHRADGPRPTLIGLHGLGEAAHGLARRALAVDRWLDLGLDVALLTLPLHGERRGGRAGGGPRFPSADLVWTNEGVGQAVWDVRALAALLRGRGAPAVGVIGVSLGGYVAALTAAVEPALAIVAALTPAVSLADLMWDHAEASPLRRRAERSGVDRALLAEVLAPHAPLGRPARLPPERLFVAAGRADRVTPPAEAEALARHWSVPVRWFAGGHIAPIGRGAALDALAAQLVALGLTAPRAPAADSF